VLNFQNYLGENLRIHYRNFIALISNNIGLVVVKQEAHLDLNLEQLGANANAARTAGISISFVTTTTMFICGGLSWS
jgi:general nucleoside transport system permease protein